MQPFVFGSTSNSIQRPSAIQPLATDSEQSIDSSEPESAAKNSGETEKSPATEAPTGVRIPPSVRPKLRGEQVWSNAVSPDGRFVVRATTTRRVILTDMSTHAETDLSDQRLTSVAFSPVGDWFVAAGQDGRVTIWNSLTGELLRTVFIHEDVLRSVAISPTGDSIAVGSRAGSVLLSSLATGQSIVELASYSSPVNCVRFSSNGRQLAAAVGDWLSSNQGEVALLDVETGQTLASLKCETSPGALAFASNDELIVGHWDGRTQLWNLVNLQVIGSAMAQKSVVAAAAFSQNNPVLREVTFEPTEPNVREDNSPLSLLRSLFAAPARAGE